MTQEEKYQDAMFRLEDNIGSCYSEDIQNYMTSLEQRIAELESSKTCEVCKHLDHCSIVQTQYYLNTATFYCSNYKGL